MQTQTFKLAQIAISPEGINELPNKLWPFIWHFIKQGKWPILLLMVLEGIAVGLNSLAPLFYREMVNSFSQPEQMDWNRTLWLFVTMVGTLFVLQPIVSRAGGWLGWPLFFVHFRERVRFQLTAHTRAQSLSFFTEDFAGRIANKIREGGYAISEIASISVYVLWGFVVSLVITGTLLFQAHWSLLVAFVAWLVVYLAYLAWYAPKLLPVGKRAADLHSKTSGLVVDSITNIMLVKLFGQDKFEEEYLLKHQQETAHASYENHKTIQIMWIGMSILTFLLAAPIIGITLLGLHQGWLGKGDAVMAITLLPQMLAFAWWTAESCSNLFEHISNTEDAMNTLAKPYTITDAPAATELKVNKGSGKGGEVRFRNVTFHYGKDAENGGGVLHNLSLTIPAGQKVGLVGKSGAGKSTLVNLLLRFYDVEGGQITIDGQNIAHVTQQSLRRHIAMVTQDSSLLHRSIADNIRYGNPTATDEEVVAAAKRAHAHSFILTLEDKAGRKGYEAHVGERGVKLSGGQRQRIAIARVILENAPILLLDEATSALDSEVEAAIQEEMKTLMEGKTTIAIAHRLSTIAQMDRLVVMDKGNIVEDGTHAELIAKGGIYAQLWQRQSGGFLGHD